VTRAGRSLAIAALLASTTAACAPDPQGVVLPLVLDPSTCNPTDSATAPSPADMPLPCPTTVVLRTMSSVEPFPLQQGCFNHRFEEGTLEGLPAFLTDQTPLDGLDLRGVDLEVLLISPRDSANPEECDEIPGFGAPGVVVAGFSLSGEDELPQAVVLSCAAPPSSLACPACLEARSSCEGVAEAETAECDATRVRCADGCTGAECDACLDEHAACIAMVRDCLAEEATCQATVCLDDPCSI
jgi:hypothetical protein